MNNNYSKKVVSSDSSNFLSLYCHFIYKFFGRNLLRQKKFKTFFYNKIYNKKYELILKKANLKIMPEEYFISIYLTILFILSLGFVLSISILFFNNALGFILFYTNIILVFFLGVFLYNYPIILARTRKDEIDAAIPYLLPYMKILSKELNISKIIEIIDDFLIYKEIKTEFIRIKHYSDFLGYDIHSSIREAMQSCPSRQLADLMNDLVTISNSGGDIYSYLERKLNNLNSEIDALEKKSLDTLLIFSQVYVVILLITPLFFTIMSSVLNLIQISSTTGGESSTNVVALIFFELFLLPFLYAMFMMLVYYSKPLYARLKPIKSGFGGEE